MRILFLLSGLLFLSGCSWFSDEEDPAITPAELTDFSAEIEVQKLWSSKLGSGAKDYLISLRPSANADTIFAADYDGTVSALDINTGESKWQVNLNAMVTGGVGYGANKVMVGTVEGEVFVLDSANGATLWSSQVSSEILSSPQTNGDIVVVHSIDNQMVALDATTGEQRWRHNGEAPILSVRGTSASIVTDSMVISGFDSGKLIAFNATNGSLIWETRIALPKGRTELERMVDIDGAPLLVGDVIYAVTYQGRLGAISRGTGRDLWSQDTSSHQAPEYREGRVFVSAAEDTIQAFASGSGQQIWSNDQLFLRRVTGPVALKNTVAVADAEGYLHFLSAEDGHFVGRTKVSGGTSAPLTVVKDRLFVQANNGTLTAFTIQ